MSINQPGDFSDGYHGFSPSLAPHVFTGTPNPAENPPATFLPLPYARQHLSGDGRPLFRHLRTPIHRQRLPSTRQCLAPLLAYGFGMLSTALLSGEVVLAAGEPMAEEATVPKREYDKLKQEVQLLKEQMKMLMDERTKTAQRQAEQTKQTQPAEKKPAAGERSTLTGTPPPSREMGLKEGDREKEAEQARKDLDEFLRRQKVLFTNGDLQVEYNTTYVQDSTEVIPVKNEFKSVSTGLFVRYGVADDVELNVSVPFVFTERSIDPRFSRIGTNPPQIYERRDDAGLGDVSGALRWGAWHEEGLIPETTLSLNFKSDTGRENAALGTGFWNVGANVSLVKTIDPVVFFGSLGYIAVLPQGGIDPGDQVPYSFGMGFSLNDRVSLSMALNGAALLRTSIDHSKPVLVSTGNPNTRTLVAFGNLGPIPGSGDNISTLTFTSTIQLTKHLFLEPFVGVGLTEESTDFIAGISIPYRFEQRFPLPFVD
jgi:hypothetical protein